MFVTINIQRLLCTVRKFHVVKEAKKAVLSFVQSDFLGELLAAKCVDLSLLLDTVQVFQARSVRCLLNRGFLQ